VAAALLSAIAERPLPPDVAVFGEIALSGDVRPVGRTELRLKEARKLGFARAYAPLGADAGVDEVMGVARVADLAAALGASPISDH
jgi:DNA repair protein RadA/Sms